MGYGVIHIKNNKMSLLAMGSINLTKIDTHFMKLKKIFERTNYLIDEYKPDEVAIEAPFMGKNPQSMLKLGRKTRNFYCGGVVERNSGNRIFAKKIKQSITCKGTASKEQVAGMLVSLLKIKTIPTHLDASDGLAVAVCHYFQMGKPVGEKGYTGWKAFIKENPGRAK